MIIKSIYIKSMGSLSEFSLDFASGINIIEGRNEAGKSTVAAFVKFIFYGMSGRGDFSERKRYMNFDSAFMGGSLTLEHEGKEYNIERGVSVSSSGDKESAKESLRVTDTATEKQVFKGEIPGEVFLGVAEEAYGSTLYLRQLADTAIDAHATNDAVENILFSGDERADTAGALKKLETARKQLHHKNRSGGRIAELEAEIASENAALADARRANSEIIAKEGKLAEKKEQISAKKRELASCREKLVAAGLLADLKQFERLARTKAQAEEATAALDEKKLNGYLPDRAYTAELRALSGEFSSLDNTVAASANERTRLSLMSGEIEKLSSLADKIGEYGGAEKLAADIDKTKKRASVLTVAGAVATLLALVCASLRFFANIGFELPLAIGMPLFIGIGAVCFILAATARRKGASLLSLFGGLAGESAEDALKRLAENKKEIEEYKNAVTKIDGSVAACNEKRGELNRRLSLALSRIGEDAGADALPSLCEKLDGITNDINEIKARLSGLRAAADASAEILRGKNEEEIRAALAAIPDIDESALDTAELDRNARGYENQLVGLAEQERELETSLAALRAASLDPVVIEGHLYELTGEYNADKLRRDAIELAIESIGAASEKLRENVSPCLAAEACRSLDALSGGAHSVMRVSSSLDVSYDAAGATRDIEYLSGGTRALAYLSLRLALAKLLFGKSPRPLVFDESFAHQDDERASAILKLLSSLAKEGQQCIILTCHTREARLAAEHGIAASVRELSAKEK